MIVLIFCKMFTLVPVFLSQFYSFNPSCRSGYFNRDMMGQGWSFLNSCKSRWYIGKTWLFCGMYGIPCASMIFSYLYYYSALLVYLCPCVVFPSTHRTAGWKIGFKLQKWNIYGEQQGTLFKTTKKNEEILEVHVTPLEDKLCSYRQVIPTCS
jgi:hypothetical protein